MSFGAGFFDHLHWGWLEFFLSWGRKGEKPIPFSPEVESFLTNTIQFEDCRGTALYLLVKRIELMETPLDQQYTFDFEISPVPPPPDYAPRTTRWQPSEIETTVYRYGEQAPSTILYGYVFSSLNSLEQNKGDLREFVLAQRERHDEMEVKYESNDEDASTQSSTSTPIEPHRPAPGPPGLPPYHRSA
jgi:hypothetical protein